MNDRSRARFFLPCVVAGAGLVCVMSVAASYGTMRQEAGPSKAAEAATKPAAPQQAIDLVDQGNSLLEQNDFGAAESTFQKAIQEDPEFVAAHRGLGIALWRQGQLGPAWQELSKVTQLEPASAQAHFELGQLAWSISSDSAAKAATTAGLSPDDFRSLALSEVSKAVSLSPRDFEMRLELSQLEVDAGRKKDAQADALGAIPLATTASERALAHVALAQAWLESGDQMRAEAEFKKAMRENPASGTAYLGLGQICLSQQNPVEAEKYFQRAIQVSPDLAPAYSALAKLFLDAHQPGEARKMLEKAVALDPQAWQSQYQLAKFEMEAGEPGRAKVLLTKIFAEHPDFLAAGEQLALMQLRQGDVQGAIAQAQTLVAHNPRAAEGHRVLALAFWRERQTDASLGECALALGVDARSVSMLALQSLELWQTKDRRDAQRILRDVAQSDPSVLSPLTFCRLIVCVSGDIPLIGEFLHQNQWILRPPDAQ
jgi:Tfp pilus assembly protein PilF